MEDKTMKRMILGTMMCVLMATGASAQVQDSIAKRDFRGERPHPGKEFREGRPFKPDSNAVVMEHPGRPDFREGKHRQAQHEGFKDRDFKPEQLTPEQHAEAKAKFLTEKLTLTRKQSEKLQKVFLKESEAFLKLKAETEGQDEAVKKEEFKKLKANTDKQVKKILTEEEYAKYKEMQKADCQHQHRHHIMPNNHPNHPDNRRDAGQRVEKKA